MGDQECTILPKLPRPLPMMPIVARTQVATLELAPPELAPELAPVTCPAFPLPTLRERVGLRRACHLVLIPLVLRLLQVTQLVLIPLVLRRPPVLIPLVARGGASSLVIPRLVLPRLVVQAPLVIRVIPRQPRLVVQAPLVIRAPLVIPQLLVFRRPM